MVAFAKDSGVECDLLRSVTRVNATQRERFLAKLLQLLGGATQVSLWGLSFKPETDDIRDAPSLDLIKGLIARGVHVHAFDPVSNEMVKKHFKQGITFYDDIYQAAAGVKHLAILTEWNVFKGAELSKLRHLDTILDGRNLFDTKDPQFLKVLADTGIAYHSVGRPALGAPHAKKRSLQDLEAHF